LRSPDERRATSVKPAVAPDDETIGGIMYGEGIEAIGIHVCGGIAQRNYAYETL
jgi:hypothetical protein